MKLFRHVVLQVNIYEKREVETEIVMTRSIIALFSRRTHEYARVYRTSRVFGTFITREGYSQTALLHDITATPDVIIPRKTLNAYTRAIMCRSYTELQ